MMKQPLKITLLLVINLAVSLPFIVYPELDIAISRPYFDSGLKLFPQDNQGWSEIIYQSVTFFAWGMGLAALIWLCRSLWRCRKSPASAERASVRKSAFLLLTLAVIPGIFVHNIMKPTWDRPRPRHTEPFGGTQPFLPMWQIAPAGVSGSSFISGHASTAATAVALAYTIPRFAMILYPAGIIFALAAAASRIVQGGHFASDVLISISLTCLIIHLLALALLRPKSTLKEKHNNP